MKLTIEAEPKEALKNCAYLECKNEGVIIDDVETAPGVIVKDYVCEEHQGQLVENILLEIN